MIPPAGWVARRNGYDDIDLVIPEPIRQEVRGQKGIFQVDNIVTRPLSVKEYAAMAARPEWVIGCLTDWILF